MSLAVGVHAVIGLRLPLKVLFGSEEVRCCDHIARPFPICPECGQPMYRKVFRASKLIYSTKTGQFSIPDLALDVFVQCRHSNMIGPDSNGVVFANIDDGSFVYIGCHVSCVSEQGPLAQTMRPLNFDQIALIKIKLREYFEPANPWDETAFGLHVFST